jgi:hypothetical protein
VGDVLFAPTALEVLGAVALDDGEGGLVALADLGQDDVLELAGAGGFFLASGLQLGLQPLHFLAERVGGELGRRAWPPACFGGP